jgi:hypothetical protein
VEIDAPTDLGAERRSSRVAREMWPGPLKLRSASPKIGPAATARNGLMGAAARDSRFNGFQCTPDEHLGWPRPMQQ